MSGTKVIPPETPKCPQCGRPLPAGALAGLCPACLLKQGAAEETATGGQTPPFQPPSLSELAPLFPQLEILELIGKGGMGAVYKARQKDLDRIVALKILPPGIGNDPAFAGRFAREAKALAKLNHPGIVTLYEFGVAAGVSPAVEPGILPGGKAGAGLEYVENSGAVPGGKMPPSTSGGTPDATKLYFFLMEFVDGVNLRQLLHAGRIAPREALAIVPQICDALQFAHDQGIVHRDIKPENLLLDRRGRVKVADFGLAKLVGIGSEPIAGEGIATGSPVLTESGKVLGTPNYMAPEQKEHPDAVDHRADIYALGVVFYQMLTGELPGKRLEPPSSKVQIDVRLDEVVLRALEKKPELRYQQVSVLKTQVETIAMGTGNADARRAFSEPRFSRPAIAGVCLGVAALMLFALSYLVDGIEIINPTVDSELVSQALAALGVLCLSISTVLGWVAVSQIRRSVGRLRGLGLAVFDGLLFPLLAFDGLIFALGVVFVGGWDKWVVNIHSDTAWAAILPVLIVAVLSNIGIVRGVWRVVNKLLPAGGGRPEVGSRKASVFETQVETMAQAPVPDDTPPNAMAANKSPLVRILEILFNLTFTSPSACRLINVSVLGVLIFLAFLGSVPFPGWQRCSAFLGLAGFFGLIGLALIVEFFTRRTTPDATQAAMKAGVGGFFQDTGLRLLLIIVTHLALFEVLLQASVHERWKESTEELWLMALGAVTLGGLIWAFWPGYRQTRSILFVVLSTVVSAALVLAVDNFYSWQLRPILGIGREPAKTFSIGQAWFPEGDSIEIISVERPANRMVVKGHYNLVSRDQAMLALYITSTNQDVPEDSQQRTQISKGRGDFELVHSHLVPGLPHVSLYSTNGQSFAALYFGTKAEAADESKADWISETNQRLGAVMEFGPVIERTLPLNDLGYSYSLDLDADVMQPLPSTLTMADWSSGITLPDGIMVIASATNRALMVAGTGTRVVPLRESARAWENPQLAQLDFPRRLKTGQTESVSGESSSPPVTFAFLTQQGARGLLQITGFIENPRGVKIRYKLVQNGKAREKIVDSIPSAHTTVADMATSTDAALPTILTWLGLVDGGQYVESWRQASESFHVMVTQADWVDKLEGVRKPLGKLLSRTVEQTAPNGAYFVAKFDSSFAGLKDASETVTFVLETNGQWRAVAYFILPRSTANSAAVEPAQAWLRNIDNGNYAQSWTNAAAYFQSAITSENWVEAVRPVRKPLGPLVSRTVKSAQEMSSLPGAPDGRYIVMQFETSFANKISAVETVTFMLEKDGQWRAAGYFIR